MEVKTDGKHVTDQHANRQLKMAEVSIVAENMDWLVRSLVGSTLKPFDHKSLRRAICKNVPHVVEVSELGACKVLITFDSVKHADELFTFKLDRLLQFFHKVWRWKVSERCETRRVWLEYYGVPLHVRSSETFKTIGGQWGDVIRCDIDSGVGSSFRAGQIQVDTGTFEVIRDWIYISIGESGFDVYVNEVGYEACGGRKFGTGPRWVGWDQERY
ncbi:hypothetical protein AHAS_Ahas03G0220200 [Arachis hypogaea]